MAAPQYQRAHRRYTVLAASLAAAAALAVAAVPAQAGHAVPGQLLVGFKKGVSNSARKQLVQNAGGTIRARLAHIRGAVVHVRHGVALKLLRRRLKARPEVRYAEPDFYERSSRVPDDPLFTTQYALGTSSSGSIDAQKAWDSRTGCAKVAVLDSGIQANHPDLKQNIWHNTGEINGNGKDDDHNGYVDDYYGVNLLTGRGSGGDENGHGTHVAGIIASDGNNGTGVSGLCWSSQLIAVKFMDAKGVGATSGAIKGIEYAVHEGALILNCSFGSSEKSSAFQDEVKYAKSKNRLIVVAAGNDGKNLDSKPSYPAAYPEANILTVAATTAKGGLASFSNYGKNNVDLGAPGDAIESTWLKSGYRKLSGTSMAAPYVAAAAAMLSARKSGQSYMDLKNALTKSVRRVNALKGKTVTGGILDIAAALKY